MKNIIVFLICSVASSQAQIPAFGSCPNVTAVSDFNSSQIIGKWYETERYFSILQMFSKCNSVEFSQIDNDTFVITNKQLDLFSQESGTNTTAVLSPIPNIGQFTMKIPLIPVDIGFTYNVLGTDYTTFAVTYTCSDIIGYNTKMLWILTRNRFPSDEIMNNAYKVLDDNNLDRNLLSKTEQFQCPIFH